MGGYLKFPMIKSGSKNPCVLFLNGNLMSTRQDTDRFKRPCKVGAPGWWLLTGKSWRSVSEEVSNRHLGKFSGPISLQKKNMFILSLQMTFHSGHVTNTSAKYFDLKLAGVAEAIGDSGMLDLNVYVS